MVKNIGDASFGIEIKKTLIELEKTQKELAKKIGITYQYLSQILSGKSKKNLTENMKERILEALTKWGG